MVKFNEVYSDSEQTTTMVKNITHNMTLLYNNNK